MARLRSLGLVAILATSACATWTGARGKPEAEVRAAITAANAEFARALVAGDAHGMAAVFTDDGEIVPETQRALVSGRADIEAYYAKRLEGRRFTDVDVTTVHLGVSADLAWETGTNRLTVRQGETAPVTLTGRYLAVWKRDPEGRWRIRAEVLVADPAP